MNIKYLRQKYDDNWEYLTSPKFSESAVRCQQELGTARWASLKPYYMATDMIVYNYHDNSPKPPPTSLILIHKLMSNRPKEYTYIDKTWLVIYTVEWADYLHKVKGVPADKIWVFCDNEKREDVCSSKGYHVIRLSSVTKINDKGKPKLDLEITTWKKDMKKFDNIVGNPPFDYDGNSSFYIEFIKLSQKIIKNDGYFDFIIPNRFLTPKSNAGKAINKWLEATYVMPSVNHYFDIGTEVGAISGIAKSNPKFNIIPYDFDNGVVIYRSLNSISPVVGICSESFSIVDKVVNSTFTKMKTVSKDNVLKHYVYIQVAYERWSPLKESGGPLRFRTMINAVDEQVGNKVEFSSDDEAEVNEWFIAKSKLGRFLTYSFAATSWATSSLVHAGGMPSLPVIRLDSGNLVVNHNNEQIPVVLNDQFLYNLFKLSSDDIKYLESKMLSLDSKKDRTSKKKVK